MSTELQRARATAERRQEAVQDALRRDYAEARAEFDRAGYVEGEAWNLADAYRRLFLGFDLDVDELLDHAGREAEAALDQARDAGRTGRPLSAAVVSRALYLDGFTDATFLWAARLDERARSRELPADELIVAHEVLDWAGISRAPAADAPVYTLVERIVLAWRGGERASREADRQATAERRDYSGERGTS